MTGPASATTEHRWHTPATYDRATAQLQQRNAAMVARLHPRPDSVHRAYEIGCGTGALTQELTAVLSKARITALDISADMLERARRRDLPPERVDFRLGSFLDVPDGGGAPAGEQEQEGGYDAVFSNAALHWMYPHYAACFGRIRRMLAPSGLVCAATAGRTPATEAFDRRIEEAVRPILPSGDGSGFKDRRLTGDEAAGHAIAGGLAVDDVFLVERRRTLSAPAYAAWWVASGGPWAAGQPEERAAVDLLADALGGTDAEVELVHASVFMVLHRD